MSKVDNQKHIPPGKKFAIAIERRRAATRSSKKSSPEVRTDGDSSTSRPSSLSNRTPSTSSRVRDKSSGRVSSAQSARTSTLRTNTRTAQDKTGENADEKIVRARKRGKLTKKGDFSESSAPDSGSDDPSFTSTTKPPKRDRSTSNARGSSYDPSSERGTPQTSRSTSSKLPTRASMSQNTGSTSGVGKSEAGITPVRPRKTATGTPSSTAHLAGSKPVDDKRWDGDQYGIPKKLPNGTKNKEHPGYIGWLRNQIKHCENKILQGGPAALTLADLKNMKFVIDELTYNIFIPEHPEWIEKEHLYQYLKRLSSVKNYGDDVAEGAKKLSDRWKRGDYEISSVFPESEDVHESSDEEVVNTDTLRPAGSGITHFPSYRTQHVADVMRGILRIPNKKGSVVYKLNPDYPRPAADVWGHNGLTVGAWWPYQICALRDGAHGARMGGIYGKNDFGAYSIVVAGKEDYHDKDMGDTIFYSGSHGQAPLDGDPQPTLTNATKQLSTSFSRNKVVRVLRKAAAGSRYAPRCGLRYDGLYKVINREVAEGRRGERNWYKFTLKREPGQTPLADLDVSQADYAAWVELQSL